MIVVYIGSIDEAKQFEYQIVDATLVLRNWYIGKRIDEEVLEGKDRAKYGAEVIDKLSKELTGIYGKGYSKRILYQCLKMYRMFPRIVNEARSQLGVLSWTHYRILTQQLENGTKKKLMSKYGVQQPCKEIKNPVIAEFLGMQQDTSYLESDLEQSIIDNLQKFLMELGKGYAFVARQQHIHTEKEDY